MSSTAIFKRVNTGVPDALWFSTNVSAFTHKNWNALTNYIKDWKEYSVGDPDGPGTTRKWRLFRETDFLSKCVLKVVIPTPGGTPGTYHRFHNWTGFDLIDTVTTKYTGQEPHDFRGEDMYKIFRTNFDERTRQAWSNLMAGDTSDAERDLLAAGTQTLYIPLFLLFFAHSTHAALPNGALANDVIVQVKFKQAQDILNTDYTSPTVTWTSTLKTYEYHVTTIERGVHLAEAETEHGILWHAFQNQYSNGNLIPSGTTSWTQPIRGITGPIVEMYVTFWQSADRTAGTGTAYNTDPWNYQVWQDITIIADNNRELVHKKDFAESQYLLLPEHHTGAPGEPIYNHSFALLPEDKWLCTGSIDFTNLNNPQLVINFPAATTVNYYCDIMCVMRQVIQLKDADLSKAY
jgi:hypothetical protein